MKRRLTLEFVTPEKPILSEAVDFVVLPALEGEMGVLPGHEPYLVQLRPGEIRVHAGEGRKSFAVSGGFAEVQRDTVAVFAETAEMAEDIDIERARQALEHAKAEARDRDLGAMTLAQAEAAMHRAEVRLRVASLRRRPMGSKGRNKPS